MSLVIAGLIGLDLRQYLAVGGASADSHMRVIHKIVTSTDLPLVAIWIGSVVNVVCCRWFAASADQEALDQEALDQVSSSTEPAPSST